MELELGSHWDYEEGAESRMGLWRCSWDEAGIMGEGLA